MKHILSLALTFLVMNIAHAQFFQTGQDPSHIKWRQINTDKFQIIYPEDFEKEAQRLTFVLTKTYEYGTMSMDVEPKKISVVLHTYTSNSNGLVAWAPKRMEFFTTPHQKIYSQDWLEQLALHEFRHQLQMDKIQSELPFLIKMILGEQATALVTGLYLPLWLMEGEAVVAETAQSNSGRGRSASFSMEYRAQLAEKGKYSYDKAYLGSYKDFVPDHYKLGYWLSAKSREKYGPTLWSDVWHNVARNPHSITPFYDELKDKTGLTRKKLYNQVFNELSNNWKQDLASSPDREPIVSTKKKRYTSYLYPEFYHDSLLVAYRTAIDDIGRFVLIDPKGNEKIIYTPGTVYEESVSFRDHWLIWAERKPDIRWTHADKSVINVLDIETKNKHTLHLENKVFSPAVSPDLKTFAAIEADYQNNFYLAVFELMSGRLVQRFKTSDNQYFFTPCWDEKGEKLYFVALSSKGKYLASYDPVTRQFQQITSATYGNIKNPVVARQQIVFSADFSGEDRLYSLDTKTQKIYLLHDARFGADYPSAVNSSNQLVFSDYTAMGYQLSMVDLGDKTPKVEVSDISLQPDQLADHLASQEKGIPDFSKPDTLNYHSKPYSKLGHLFNFHSWAPAYIDINSYEVRPGLSLLSQNKLGTAETQVGYDYDVTDRVGKYRIGFNYYGWFPEFTTSVSFGKDASSYNEITNTYNQFNQLIKSDTLLRRFTWNEWTADLNIRLPLNLSAGKYASGIFPEFMYAYNQIKPNKSAPDNFSSDYYHALAYRLSYYHLLHRSRQNIIPRWGQQFELLYKHTPFAGRSLGSLAGIQTVLYFPGLAKNNGIRIYQGLQQKSFSQLSAFSDLIRFPRGYYSLENKRMYSMAVDYVAPLAYPDLSVGKLIYLKRIKSSCFYDYAYLSMPLVDANHQLITDTRNEELISMGIELTSDLHFLRFYAPFEIGFRSIYMPKQNSFGFNLLLSVDFNGF